MLPGGFFPRRFPIFEKKIKKDNDEPRKWDIMFKDASIEGRKHGCNRAAKEFEPVYIELKQKMEKTKSEIIEEQRERTAAATPFAYTIDKLRVEKDTFERTIQEKINSLSKKMNVSSEAISSDLNMGTLFGSSSSISSRYLTYSLGSVITDIIYEHKLENWRKSELEGYKEVKEQYTQKINTLNEEFNRLVEEAKNVRKDFNKLMIDMIEEIKKLLSEISQLQIKNAQLSIFLAED